MSDWLAQAAPDAPPLLGIVLDAALKGCVLLALAGVAALALRRDGAAARHLAWTSALGGLLVLPLLSAVLPRWGVTLPARPDVEGAWLAEAVPAPEPPAPEAPTPQEDRRKAPSAFVRREPVRLAPRPAAGEPPPVVAPVSAGVWLLRVWALGVAVALVPPLLGVASLARLARSTRPVTDPARLRLLDRLRRQLGLTREVRLVQSARRVMPMTWGVFRPTLLLPDDADAWPEDALRVVLLHELAHVRRWDCLTQLLAGFACALHWFNPLAWLALAQARGEQERACDDCVLNSGSDPSDYAEQLLMIASGRRSSLLSGSVALAMAASSRIERRLRSILDTKRGRRPLSSWRLVLAAAAAVGCALPLASLTVRTAAAEPPKVAAQLQVQPANVEAALKDPAEVLAAVRAHYIKDTDESELRHGAIRGLMDALHDPHSQYLDPKQTAGLNRQIQGTLTGIGVMLELKGGRPAVRNVLPNSPAHKAGVKTGDVITEIDGKATEGLEMNEITRRIIGPPGAPVSLTLEADGRVRAKPTITRAAIQIESVEGFSRGEDHRWSFLLDPAHRIGYAHVNQFSPTTAKDLGAALEALDGQGLKGLVLDLRDCPGGLLDAALSCVNLFLAKGKILSVRGRGQDEKTFEADGKAPLADVPLVVLINGQTASAAEIVSGALKDNDRAVLVGSRTYGKGSVQTLISLKDNQGAIKLTTAYYYLPGGRNIDRVSGKKEWGVDPTEGDVVPLNAQQAEALRKRREARGATDSPAKPAAEVTPERLATEESDPQLAAALKALIAKATKGEFAKVGEPAGQHVAHDDRLEQAQKRREALLDDLKKVERELEDLKTNQTP